MVVYNIPEGVFSLVIGDVETVGKPMSEDRRIPLVSATGSTRMGKEVATKQTGLNPIGLYYTN